MLRTIKLKLKQIDDYFQDKADKQKAKNDVKLNQIKYDSAQIRHVAKTILKKE